MAIRGPNYAASNLAKVHDTVADISTSSSPFRLTLRVLNGTSNGKSGQREKYLAKLGS